MKKYTVELINDMWCVIDSVTGSVIAEYESENAAWNYADELSDFEKRH